ncbi:hypothetical protein [Armatimonas sp.]|uniref:hypothetical protein n=1 Tax=Armatimonas sp. TaxID=1872638 RepID=UPI00286D1990|nr:hypothetical protein [Armatimonas sp.]
MKYYNARFPHHQLSISAVLNDTVLSAMPDKTPKRHQIARRPVVKKTKARFPLRRFVFDGELYIGFASGNALANSFYQQTYWLWRGGNKKNQPLRICWTMPRYDFWLFSQCLPDATVALPHRGIFPHELASCVRQAREQGWTGELRTATPFELVVDDRK